MIDSKTDRSLQFIPPKINYPSKITHKFLHTCSCLCGEIYVNIELVCVNIISFFLQLQKVSQIVSLVCLDEFKELLVVRILLSKREWLLVLNSCFNEFKQTKSEFFPWNSMNEDLVHFTSLIKQMLQFVLFWGNLVLQPSDVLNRIIHVIWSFLLSFC